MYAFSKKYYEFNEQKHEYSFVNQAVVFSCVLVAYKTLKYSGILKFF